MTLPNGFKVITQAGSDRTRARTTIEGPGGTRVTWYEDGDVRVYREGHTMEEYDRQMKNNSVGRGETVNIRFHPIDQ